MTPYRRRTVSIVPLPTIESTTAPEQMDNVGAFKHESPRVQKKREVDRRSQRVKREKTRTRIAELEALVHEFQARDSSGQIALLRQQLSTMEKSRDALAKTIQDITNLATGQKHASTAAQNSCLGTELAASELQENSCLLDDTSHILDIQAYTNVDPELPRATLDMNPHLVSTRPKHAGGQDVNRSKSNNNFLRPEQAFHHINNNKQLLNTCRPGSPNHECAVDAHCADPIVPPARSACSCSLRNRQAHIGQVVNLWRYANETLMERFKTPNIIHPAEDAMSEDIPVRAIIEGWDAVSTYTDLPHRGRYCVASTRHFSQRATGEKDLQS